SEWRKLSPTRHRAAAERRSRFTPCLTEEATRPRMNDGVLIVALQAGTSSLETTVADASPTSASHARSAVKGSRRRAMVRSSSPPGHSSAMPRSLPISVATPGARARSTFGGLFLRHRLVRQEAIALQEFQRRAHHYIPSPPDERQTLEWRALRHLCPL